MRYYHIQLCCLDEYDVDNALALTMYIKNIVEPERNVRFNGTGYDEQGGRLDIFIDGDILTIDRIVRPILRVSGFWPSHAIVDAPYIN